MKSPADSSKNRVLISALGTLGDLFPALSMGREFSRNGFTVTVATHPDYESRVLAEGFRFAVIGSSIDELTPDDWLKVTTSKNSSEFIFRNYIIPNVRNMYEQLDAAGEFDLYIVHPLAMAHPLLAERRGVKWISYALAPISMFSSKDASVFDGLPLGIGSERPFSARWSRYLMWLANLITGSWARPIKEIRKELGLKPSLNPVMHGQYSPFGTWALFSPEFQSPQTDWPSYVSQLGFPLYHEAGAKLSARTAEFLSRYEKPVVFTLGTAAVRTRSDFFLHVMTELRHRGRPSILLAGSKASELAQVLGEGSALVVAEEPHHLLFPHASVIVHSCGIGTSAEALASGVPQIPVPFANDQPDNAYRIERLGVGARVPWRKFTEQRFFNALDVAETSAVKARAAEVARAIGANNFSKGFDQALGITAL